MGDVFIFLCQSGILGLLLGMVVLYFYIRRKNKELKQQELVHNMEIAASKQGLYRKENLAQEAMRKYKG
ncbi:MAG: hypothetical protein KAS32_15875 [Candidatus Peribacteraceae bacterium]|nr:hypothetical protein [Candidatus Peribacteraceae bacterium]